MPQALSKRATFAAPTHGVDSYVQPKRLGRFLRRAGHDTALGKLSQAIGRQAALHGHLILRCERFGSTRRRKPAIDASIGIVISPYRIEVGG